MGSCGSKDPSVEGSAAPDSRGVSGGTEKKASAPAETQNMVSASIFAMRDY
jgi:hypothetical protein